MLFFQIVYFMSFMNGGTIFLNEKISELFIYSYEYFPCAFLKLSESFMVA